MRENRPTKTINTAGGHEIVMYSYITGGESREISNIFLSGMKLQVDATGQTKSNELDASLAGSAQDKAIELLVISIDGVKENILRSVLDLPKNDFDEVLAEVDKIQNGITSEKKTN